jgi:hypothetical protein
MKRITKLAVSSLLVTAFLAAPVAAFAGGGPPGSDKKTNNAAPPTGEKKQGIIPFKGKITAVDKSAKTVTVGGNTYHVTSDTKIVKGNKPGTFDDAVAGEEAGGAYRKSEDGKMNLVSLRVGPKIEKAAGATTGK